MEVRRGGENEKRWPGCREPIFHGSGRAATSIVDDAVVGQLQLEHGARGAADQRDCGCAEVNPSQYSLNQLTRIRIADQCEAGCPMPGLTCLDVRRDIRLAASSISVQVE